MQCHSPENTRTSKYDMIPFVLAAFYIDVILVHACPVRYPRPGLTVDACIVSKQRPPKILLIKRQKVQDQWALPGGFVDENEPLEKAAARELQEETSVNPKDVLLTQVFAC